MSLKCYCKDWTENTSAWKRKTDKQNADKIVKKLRRHFKVEWKNGKHSALYNRKSRGSASLSSNRICLPGKNISLGMINHEIAHLVARKRYGSKRHDKKFLKALKIVNHYVQRKNFYDRSVKWNCKSKQMHHIFRVSSRVEYLL